MSYFTQQTTSYLRAYVMVLLSLDRCLAALCPPHSLTQCVALIALVTGTVFIFLLNTPTWSHYGTLTYEHSGEEHSVCVSKNHHEWVGFVYRISSHAGRTALRIGTVLGFPRWKSYRTTAAHIYSFAFSTIPYCGIVTAKQLRSTGRGSTPGRRIAIRKPSCMSIDLQRRNANGQIFPVHLHNVTLIPFDLERPNSAR